MARRRWPTTRCGPGSWPTGRLTCGHGVVRGPGRDRRRLVRQGDAGEPPGPVPGEVGPGSRRRGIGAGRGPQGPVRYGRVPGGHLGPADRQLGRSIPAHPPLRHPAARHRQPAGRDQRAVPALQLGAHRGELGAAVHLRLPRRLPGGDQVHLGNRPHPAHQRPGRLAGRAGQHGRRGRERPGVRVLRLHHGPRVLRPARDRHGDRGDHGALLRLPVRRAAAPRRDRLAGPPRRADRRGGGRLDLPGTAAQGTRETRSGNRCHRRGELPWHPTGHEPQAQRPGQPGPVSLLLTNIAELVTNDGDGPGGQSSGPGTFASIPDAALVIEAGRVAWTGPARGAPAADRVTDCGGRAVLPGFVDSHAHLVFAGERSAEFAARMAGTPYHAGGIATTVAATRAASDEQLRANLGALRREMLGQGITTFECKSGYGLTVADERRSVTVAAGITGEVTFLGAHVVPPEFEANPAAYVDLVCGPMLAACAPHARWIDVFCERGAFGADEARAVLTAGRAAGLIPRIHANQLGTGPGVQLAVELGAASADHCTYLTGADVDALAGGGTVATLLPGVEFSTRSPYPDARRLLDAGVTVAIATDCNPGSCFTSSMSLCIALAVREMRLTTQEAVWAATAGGAHALLRADVGHLGVGASADLILLDGPSHAYLAYRPGVPLIAAAWRKGELAAGAVPAA